MSLASDMPEVHAHWSPNEKVACEEAIGVSYVGGRALVSMKHVGLNVAMDPFVNSAFLELNGGLVVVAADDPGMHSSQNEQDSRCLADFARVPCLEPHNQQQCYDMTRAAFDISEQYHLPVMIRIPTRLAHSRSQVKTGPAVTDDRTVHFEKEVNNWVLAPSISPTRLKALIHKNKDIATDEQAQRWNRIPAGRGSIPLGIVASGITSNYIAEVQKLMSTDLPVCHIGLFPFDTRAVKPFVHSCGQVLVIEDGSPYLEQKICLLSSDQSQVLGRQSGHIPTTGELNPRIVMQAVAQALGRQTEELKPVDLPLELTRRPPELCQGCSHRDTFTALKQAISSHPDTVVFGDIGCYTLGWLPPFSAIDTTVCMGASIGMAKGAAEGGLKHPVAIIGDSTFLHTGINGLLGAAAENTPMTVIIFNNSTTGMTGGQPLLLDGEKLRQLVIGLGVDPAHVRNITALPARHDEMAKVIAAEMDHAGLSVISSSRECIQTVKRSKT